ncbi:hypothetical protein B0H14DRAFT_2757333 [Mycena olivaceomarginata]|nr:hypothetical protein B0H14DRAFT_2757333 [Mycena olivaceomarginata]
MDPSHLRPAETSVAVLNDAELLLAYRNKVIARTKELACVLQNVRRRLNAVEADRVHSRDQPSESAEAERRALGEAWADLDLYDHLSKHPLGRAGNSRRDLVDRENSILREVFAINHHITLEEFSSSPIRRLPPEIVLEIFEAVKCAADETLITHATSPGGHAFKCSTLHGVGYGAAPVLSRVCTTWRALVCDYPLLWSSFSFRLFRSQSAEMLDVYLERAKSAPLTVEIDARRFLRHCCVSLSARSESTGKRAISRIAAHAHRLFELRVITDYQGTLPSFHPLHGRLSNQEILQIGRWPVSSTAFESVPRLHTLRLPSYAELTEAEHNFDRAQIHTLSLLDPTGKKLLAYPNITTLTCIETRNGADRIVTAPVVPPILACVRTLKVECHRREYDIRRTWGSNIFDRFTTPVLCSLDVDFRGEVSQLTRFLRRSRCSLTNLVLHECTVRISELLEILDLSPALEALAVLGGTPTTITDRLFQYLTKCPSNLTQLGSLRIAGIFAIGITALVEMLETRTAGGAATSDGACLCLNDVFLSLPHSVVPHEAMERLRLLEGITVDLECLDERRSKVVKRWRRKISDSSA